MKDKCFISHNVFTGVLSYNPEKSGTISYVQWDANSGFYLHNEFHNYIRSLKNSGVNAWRVLPWYYEPIDIQEGRIKPEQFFVPHRYEGNGRWNLTQFNNNYFDVLSQIISICIETGDAGSDGAVFMLPIIDNTAEHANYGPWISNSQGITSVYDKNAEQYIRLLMDTIFAKLAHIPKDRLYFETGNEIVGNRAIDLCMQLLIPKLLEKGVPFTQISLGINANINKNDPNGNNLQELRDRVRGEWGRGRLRETFWPIHGCLRKNGGAFGQPTTWAVRGDPPQGHWVNLKPHGLSYPIRLIFSDDGTGDGNSSCDIHPNPSAQYRTRPSVDQWREFFSWMLENSYMVRDDGFPMYWFEHWMKITSLNCQKAYFEMFNQEYRKYFGGDLANYGKYPGEGPKTLEQRVTELEIRVAKLEEIIHATASRTSRRKK